MKDSVLIIEVVTHLFHCLHYRCMEDSLQDIHQTIKECHQDFLMMSGKFTDIYLYSGYAKLILAVLPSE